MMNKSAVQVELDFAKKAKELVEEAKRMKKDSKDEALIKNMALNSTQGERVYTLLVLKIMADVVADISALANLIDIEEEEFIKVITSDGEVSLDEVEKKMMVSMLLDMCD